MLRIRKIIIINKLIKRIDMRNWKTSLAGLIAGAPFAINAVLTAYNAGSFDGKSGMQLFAAIGIVLFGLVSKDHDVSGGAKQQ